MLYLSPTGAKRTLAKMVDEGKIEKCGSGRSTYYRRKMA